MQQQRRATAVWGSVVLVAAIVACETTRNPGGIQRDLTAPSITLSNTAGDTQDIKGGLHFNVSAIDNLALKEIRLTFSGGLIAVLDTVFTGTVKTYSVPRTITFPANSGAGGGITIIGRATDGAGNFAEDTLFIFLSNVQALQVILIAPATGAVASAGKYVPIQVRALQNSGIRKIGWRASPAGQVAQTADSMTFGPAPFPDSVDFVDSVLVSGTTGFFTIVGFAEDSATRTGTSAQVVVTIQSVANDVTPPQVEQFVAIRAEANDTITVHATDPSGITRIGFQVRDLAGTLIGGDSVALGGTSTDVVRKFVLGLTFASFPQQVVVQAFAIDGAAAQNRGVAAAVFTTPSPTGAPRADTLTIVAGNTKALPAGGRIMDAAVDSALNEVYFTNIDLNRLEVLSLTTDNFVANIPVGSRPWGMALWPRDTLGNYADTAVVANSGGTNLSIVDLAGRRERRRHRLPNFEVDQVNTEIKNGVIHIKIQQHDYSDRPQYVGMNCKHQASGTCWPDSIIAVYSTTPTVDQTGQPNRGTMRWENLTSAIPQSHFFFEHATAAADPSANDTLMVIADRAWLPLADPAVSDTIVCPATGEIVKFSNIPFADTTFTRNSGDFTHAFMGEGALLQVEFARVLNYATTPGLTYTTRSADLNGDGIIDITCTTQYDNGISPGIRVRDFISNTATSVVGIATNFNGHTNMVRTTDSIYALDVGLRLGGTVAGTGGNPGMDFHRNHAFDPFDGGTPFYGGTGSPDNRLIFAARKDGGIDVFDTYNFARVTTVPIRDPVIGPLRVAKGALGTQILVGVTARGVVLVRLPNVVNIFPTMFRGVNP